MVSLWEWCVAMGELYKETRKNLCTREIFRKNLPNSYSKSVQIRLKSEQLDNFKLETALGV